VTAAPAVPVVAGAGETPALASLAHATAAAWAGSLLACGADVPGEYWTCDHLLADLPAKWSLSFAAWAAGRPVAYSILSRKAIDRVHLHHLMVLASERSKGLGSRMVLEMERRTRAAGAALLTLKVAVDNRRACSFYIGLGFALVDDSEPFLVMQKHV